MNFSITKPLSNPDTVVLGLYYADKKAAICGSYIDGYGDVHKGAIEWFGDGLASALHVALQDAKPIPALYLLVFCNHQGLVDAFTKPVSLALPNKGEKVYQKPPFTTKKDWGYMQIPTGNENQWNLIRSLCHYRKWKIVYSDLLPVSQAYYESRITASR